MTRPRAIASPFDQAIGEQLCSLLADVPSHQLNAVIGVYRARIVDQEADAQARRDQLETFIEALRRAHNGWAHMDRATRHRLIDAWDGGLGWQAPYPLGEVISDLPQMLSVAEEVAKDMAPSLQGEREPRYPMIRTLATYMEEAGLVVSPNPDSQLSAAVELIDKGLGAKRIKHVSHAVAKALRKS